MSEKEFDLKAQPFIDVTIRFHRAFDPKEGRGVTCFKFSNSNVILNGKEIGSVSGGSDGSLVLIDKSRGGLVEYMSLLDQTWEAFQAALKEKECQECGMVFDHKPGCSKET